MRRGIMQQCLYFVLDVFVQLLISEFALLIHSYMFRALEK